jgi:carbamoyl-phosphate synthase large subunit
MNILLTSIGRRSYLVDYFKKALNGEGYVFVSNSSKTIAVKNADGFLQTPMIYENNYIEVLLDFCIKNKITFVMSLFDVDLLVLAKNRELFKSNGIKIILASSEVVEICNDKWKTYNFLNNNNIGTAKTYLNEIEVLAEIENGLIEFPIIIKPRWGMASIGLYIADNAEELKVLANKCRKDIMSSYLKYESSITPDEIVVFQEKLKGQEYGIDVVNDLNGNYIGCFPKSKLLMRAGETDLGCTVSPEPFSGLAKKISNLFKHDAICSVDCFEKNGEFKIIEINCRISGHYPLSHLAGVNLPLQIIKWMNGEETDPNLFQFRTGLYITKNLVPEIIEM